MDKDVDSRMAKVILRCLVVDDEPLAREGIVSFIEKVDFLELADTCSSALEATQYLNETSVDLLFLDINMPYLSGLDFLESLKKPPLTILTTAYSEHALEGFRLQVVDYLLKPIAFKRFYQAALNALNTFKLQYHSPKDDDTNQDDVYIRQGNSFEKIAWKNILYVEAMQNYVKLHFDGEMKIIHQTLASLEDMLPKDNFFRIHKSYLVNIKHIQSVGGGKIVIGGKELPISRQRRDDLLNTVVLQNLISK